MKSIEKKNKTYIVFVDQEKIMIKLYEFFFKKSVNVMYIKIIKDIHNDVTITMKTQINC